MMKNTLYLVLIFNILFGLNACGDDQKKAETIDSPGKKYNSMIVCTVECSDTLSQKGVHKHSNGEGHEYSVKIGGTKVSTEFYDGNKSIQLTPEKKYGLALTAKNLKAEESYRVSVWRKDESKLAALVVESLNSKKLYTAKKKVTQTTENGWEKILIEFEIPKGVNAIKVYSYIASSNLAYFDHLELEKIELD
jgi:hypothetical protein